MKRKKLILFTIITFLLLMFVVTSPCFYEKEKTVVNYTSVNVEKEENVVENLQVEYNNTDINSVLEIPGIVKTPVVKTTDNKYYLNHDLYKKEDITGSIFMDYRNKTFNDKKIIIYGHNSYSEDLPFTKLIKYNSYEYTKEHDEIYLYTGKEKLTYKIFSVYVENKDFDYVNFNEFNGLSWVEHLQKLKNKSLYDTGVSVSESDKIIILQTCSHDNNYEGNYKFHLVIAKLTK